MSLFKDKPAWKNPFYSRGEEIANSITHGIGTALSIAGLTALVVLAVIYGDVWRVVSFSIYGGSLILLYLASTLYHSLQQPTVKHALRKFDHASIYILIAGTYTPFLLISLRGSLGWPLFFLIWGLAAAGIIWKMFFLGKLEVLATIIYILMGWMCIFLFKDMLATIPTLGIIMLVVGGIVYTAGVIFYAWEKLPYNHAIWHLFVLGGSVCHYVAISTLIPA